MPDGAEVPHERLTRPADPVRSYAYCSDTMPVKALDEWIHGVDLLYHEATYRDEDADRAGKYGHSTARQAAEVARQVGAKRLLIGHYSARYEDDQLLLQDAHEVFANTLLAEEKTRISI